MRVGQRRPCYSGIWFSGILMGRERVDSDEVPLCV